MAYAESGGAFVQVFIAIQDVLQQVGREQRSFNGFLNLVELVLKGFLD